MRDQDPNGLLATIYLIGVSSAALYSVTDKILPFSLIIETPWNSSPTFASTLSLLYLGVIATGLAWVLRFKVLKDNGLVFQSQVAYLIPIFGVILGYVFLGELITFKVLVALTAIVIGIYFVKKSTSSKKILSQKNI